MSYNHAVIQELIRTRDRLRHEIDNPTGVEVIWCPEASAYTVALTEPDGAVLLYLHDSDPRPVMLCGGCEKDMYEGDRMRAVIMGTVRAEVDGFSEDEGARLSTICIECADSDDAREVDYGGMI